ncbi:hypothetical protein PLAN_41074 [Planktothrix rubescens CCAP 1459/22]|uniref:Uncharacterized protein n=1 Tax=Planktothrix rubescens CCAP 1459/22 TaxID=329571 RepID=A0A6J7ZQ10_PLARU|nr:hypothetical protein PLAN_41074 [Planktothrix rubescens NIVA-CYA 18]
MIKEKGWNTWGVTPFPTTSILVFLVDVLPNFAVYSNSGNLVGDFWG